MRIRTMTATFGKLEHETLTLEPGLNIIQAPNEWGKSTWCAFLTAMLYGIETRAHSTKAALADKERYAPWSGSPMSGKIDLVWKGRAITIERSTKGRIPLGEFRAYETETGLPVSELTGSNCGQVLLGVEKSVFLRSGFLRLTDLPVTQDESLRRRLNNLVTTGDESGTGDLLAQKLKELKNRCRFNRTGLLPQAEAQLEKLEAELNQLHALQKQAQALKQRQTELEAHGQALKNHRQALEYRRSLSGNQKLLDARQTRDTLQRQLSALESLCAVLPTLADAEQNLAQLRKLQDLADSTNMEAQMLPAPPEPPSVHPVFYGVSPETAIPQAKADQKALEDLERSQKRVSALPLLPTLLLLLAGVILGLLSYMLPAAVCLIGSLLLLPLFFLLRQKTLRHNRRLAQDRQQLLSKYGSLPPETWVSAAEEYVESLCNYRQAHIAFTESRGDLDLRIFQLKDQLRALTLGQTPSVFLTYWTDIRAQHLALEDLRRSHRQAAEYYTALSGAVVTVSPPAQPDSLTCTEEETANLLSENSSQLRQLQLRLGQVAGQTEMLREEPLLLKDIAALRERITQLENTYAALMLAQETLLAASGELQRRFAPRITQRTRELFSRLTGSRYDRVMLNEHLELSAATRDEDILRSSLWHSDGTGDQLYLALRLAVAEALSPDAPLILDDALVRFDDRRLSAALEVLQEEAAAKQILLFTCQSREKQLFAQLYNTQL